MKVLSAELVATASDVSQLPRGGPPEIALLGRSNVGKSSLLNRLAARRKLARTSVEPGRTRLIHCYRVERPEGGVVLVDLPGYGWARRSKSEREGWRRLVEGYLRGRTLLRLALLLQDVRREVSDDERLLVAWLAERGIPVLVALTKLDKVGRGARAAARAAAARELGLAPEQVIGTSALAGEGFDELWHAIDGALSKPPKAARSERQGEAAQLAGGERSPSGRPSERQQGSSGTDLPRDGGSGPAPVPRPAAPRPRPRRPGSRRPSP
jgi:GTP-binding protein